MKQTMQRIALILSTLLLLTLVSACGRREHFEEMLESKQEAESQAEVLERETNTLTLDTRPRETVAVTPETKPVEPSETGAPDETRAPSETGAVDPAESGGESETARPLTPDDWILDPDDPYPNNEGYRLTGVLNLGGAGTYEGKTLEEVLAMYTPGGVFVHGADQIVTPTGVIYNPSNSDPSYYNKLTGNITALCPDPLCRHNDCVWSELEYIIFVGTEHLYFTTEGEADGGRNMLRLYRCDMERNHVEMIVEYFSYDGRIWAEDGDNIYLTNYKYREEQVAATQFGKLNAKTGEFTVLSGDMNVTVQAVVGDTVYYCKGIYERELYKTDLTFKESTLVLKTPTPLRVMNYTDEYLQISTSDSISYYPYCLYHVQTGNTVDLSAYKNSLHYISGKYAYYTKQITDAEIAASPIKNYYNYAIVNPSDQFGSLFKPWVGDAGRLWRLDLETGKEEMVVELSYNGIPIRIHDVIADGNVLHITYNLYTDFHNYYNQEWNSFGSLYGCDAYRYMCLDLSNGTITLLNPYR